MPLLLRSQKNAVFAAIRKVGLDPAEFEWSFKVLDGNVHTYHKDTLTHRPTGFYYTAYRDMLLGFSSDFAPSDTRLESYSRYDSWELQFDGLRDWLQRVEHEHTQQDLWAELTRQRSVLEAPTSAPESNEPFGSEEKQSIQARLAEFQQMVVGLASPNEEQLDRIESQIKYLTDATDRLGKRDWSGLLVGTVISLLATASLSSNQIRSAFDYLGKLLYELFDWLPPLLP